MLFSHHRSRSEHPDWAASMETRGRNSPAYRKQVAVAQQPLRRLRRPQCACRLLPRPVLSIDVDGAKVSRLSHQVGARVRFRTSGCLPQPDARSIARNGIPCTRRRAMVSRRVALSWRSYHNSVLSPAKTHSAECGTSENIERYLEHSSACLPRERHRPLESPNLTVLGGAGLFAVLRISMGSSIWHPGERTSGLIPATPQIPSSVFGGHGPPHYILPGLSCTGSAEQASWV